MAQVKLEMVGTQTYYAQSRVCGQHHAPTG